MAGQVGKLGNTAVRIEGPDGTVFYAVRIFDQSGQIAPGEIQGVERRNWTVNIPRTLAQTSGRLPTRGEAALIFAATRSSNQFVGLYNEFGSSGMVTEAAYLRQLENFDGDPNTEFGQEEKILFLDSATPQGRYGIYGGNNGTSRPIQSASTIHGGSYVDYSHTGVVAIFEESELPSGISVVEPTQQYSDMSAADQGIVNSARRADPVAVPPDSGDPATGEDAGPGGASPGAIDESEYYIINQRDREMLDFIASKESNGRYDAIYPGESRNAQITEFSINQLLQFQQRMTQGFADPSADTAVDDAARSRPVSDPAVDAELDDATRPPTPDPAADAETEDAERRAFYSRTSAAGRYQFVPSQIKEAADFLELDRDLVRFSEPVQDAMCMEILKQKCDYEGWLQGAIIVEEFQFKLSGQFESIPLPCGAPASELDAEPVPQAEPEAPEE